MNEHRLLQAGLLAASVTVAANVWATDWTQFGYDAAHSSYNRAENGYSTQTGNTIPRSYSLGTAVDSAPIYVSDVVTAAGSKNLLFIDTKDGTILAIDADAVSLGIVWSHQPVPAGGTNSDNGAPSGSPIVDAAHQFVYAFGLDGKVHKYQIGNGTEIVAGGWPEVVTLKPEAEKGAAALSISSVTGQPDYMYAVTDGYDGDGGDYQGHLTAINLADGTQKVFNGMCSDLTVHLVASGTNCSTRLGGIWGRSGAVFDPGTSRVFIVTGNGQYNANKSGGHNWGDSILALNRDGTGTGSGGLPVDAFTPTTFQALQDTDADLGSVSIALVPTPVGTAAQFAHIGVQAGGKDGCVRVINLANMGSGIGSAPPVLPKTGGELQALDFVAATTNCADGQDGPELKAQPAVWVNPADSSSWVFVASYGNGFTAYKVILATVNTVANTPQLSKRWTASSGTSAVVANGIVYYMSSGHMLALDAVTGTSVIANSSPWLTTSTAGQHWQSPILVNGRLYAIDNGSPSKLWVYQLDGIFKNTFD
jgi:hypothetical protein